MTFLLYLAHVYGIERCIIRKAECGEVQQIRKGVIWKTFAISVKMDDLIGNAIRC